MTANRTWSMPPLSEGCMRRALGVSCGSVTFLLVASCGSSSTTVTAPAAARCAVQAQAASSSFPLAGGSGSLTITTNRECGWSVASDAPWLAIVGPSSGQGDGAVKFTVASNADPAERTGAFTVNDQRLPISQAGRPCDFQLSTTREVVDAAGGERTLQVTASSAQCGWTAGSDHSWISVVSGREGRGNGSVTFRVAPMAGPPRAGTLTVAGHPVQIEQGSGCTYSIGSVPSRLPSAGGPVTVAISTSDGCRWDVSSQSTWITIRSGASGTASGEAQFIVASNGGPERAGLLTIAGRTYSVVQESGCTYSISAPPLEMPGGGGLLAFGISTAASCPWSAAGGAAWMSVSPGSGTGPGEVRFVIAPNSSISRTAVVRVAGQSFSITQLSQCTFVLAPPYLTYDASGGNGAVLVIVSGPCTWTAQTTAGWITMVSGTSGTGDGLVQFTVPANAGQARSAFIVIAGQNFPVSQSGR